MPLDEVKERRRVINSADGQVQVRVYLCASEDAENDAPSVGDLLDSTGDVMSLRTEDVQIHQQRDGAKSEVVVRYRSHATRD